MGCLNSSIWYMQAVFLCRRIVRWSENPTDIFYTIHCKFEKMAWWSRFSGYTDNKERSHKIFEAAVEPLSFWTLPLGHSLLPFFLNYTSLLLTKVLLRLKFHYFTLVKWYISKPTNHWIIHGTSVASLLLLIFVGLKITISGVKNRQARQLPSLLQLIFVFERKKLIME